MGNIRKWLIHKLGGLVPKDYSFEIEEVDARNTMVDEGIEEDDIEYAQVQIARKIGEKMLDLGLIRFNFSGCFNEKKEYAELIGKVLVVEQKV